MLTALRGALRDSSAFRAIRERLDAGRSLTRVGGAAASFLSFLAADLVEDGPGTVLLVLPRPEEAELVAEEIEGLIGEEKVFLFPSWELLPYEKHSPPIEVTALRLRALGALARGERGAIVSTPRALQTRLVPRRLLEPHLFELRAGDSLDLGALSEKLVHVGYQRSAVAGEPGTFARRGGILDVFPSGKKQPIRIELFGDEIESIREYDPESQRSTRTASSARIAPQREFPLPDETVRLAQALPSGGEEAELLSRGVFFDGIERYLPLLLPDAETLFDYLPASAPAVVLDERDLWTAASEFWSEAERFHAQAAQ